MGERTRMNRYRIVWLILLAVGVALMSGCAKVETHVYVQPQGDTEMAFAFRLPGALAAMLTGALEGAPPPPQEGQLPPGIDFSERDEGAEHVWELRMSGPMNPSHLMCRVSMADRLLTTSYDLAIDPRNANPFGALGEEGGKSPAGLAIAALGIEGVTGADADSPKEMGEVLEGLKERFGGTMPAAGEMDVGKLMEQIQPALYAHLPGCLTETNGERVDDTTARWAFTPESLMGGPKRLTASSELPEMAMIGDLVTRLNAHHGTDVTPEKMAEIVQRGLVPNPVVEDRGEAVVDSHLYGELVIAVTGLEAAVGSEKAEAVLRALDLLQPEPSLARATRAAKRLPRLREREDAANLTADEIAAILSDEAE
jgi:hypothetical protein